MSPNRLAAPRRSVSKGLPQMPTELRRFRPHRVFGTGAAVGLSLLLASCGDDGHIEVYPVSGSVKYGDEIPAGAQIALHPVGGVLPENLVAMGTVAPDGTFTIGTYDAADGAPAGEYKATIQWFKVVKSEGGVGRGPNVLPQRYTDPAKSPITVTVAEGSNELSPIAISRK